jgi:hypothetical protein
MDEDHLLDDDVAMAVRPYLLTGGRTHPSVHLGLASMVRATRTATAIPLTREHRQMLDLCHNATSIAEIGGRLRLPAAVTKILVSDLIDCGAATTRTPTAIASHDIELLEKVLNGIQRL